MPIRITKLLNIHTSRASLFSVWRALPVPNLSRIHFTIKHKIYVYSIMSTCNFSVTAFEQICARWRAVVVTYNKSTDCANMPKAVRLKCSTEVGYGYDLKNPIDFAAGKIKGIRQFSLRKLLSLFRQNFADKNNEAP